MQVKKGEVRGNIRGHLPRDCSVLQGNDMGKVHKMFYFKEASRWLHKITSHPLSQLGEQRWISIIFVKSFSKKDKIFVPKTLKELQILHIYGLSSRKIFTLFQWIFCCNVFRFNPFLVRLDARVMIMLVVDRCQIFWHNI